MSFNDVLARYEAAWRPFDDALPALRRARAAGLALGVLTNGDGAQQRAKAEQEHFIQQIVWGLDER